MLRPRLAAGASTLLLCGQYLVAEAVTASAWTHPYSYSRNFISDLGVTSCFGTGPCSPLGMVMNTGFIVAGALAILAAALLMLLVPGRPARALLTALAITHGVGSTVVGLVHSAPGTAAGTPHIHVVGAYAAIVGGNLALIVAGLAASPGWVSGWYRVFSVALGCFGLACGLALVMTRGWPSGLLERGAVDTITVWEVASGLLLTLRLVRERSLSPQVA